MEVAVHVFRKDPSDNSAAKPQADWASLKHEHVMQLYGSWVTGNEVFYVTETVAGGTLKRYAGSSQMRRAVTFPKVHRARW